ncbi:MULTISPECIES: DUF4105 domain-containing protein [unclassified Arenibacter]|uniref:lipoprotein N-acyltransferase Lnb domain-containing protein n=1 Tax=unclassified Arenibacter TaxID=2615047 RepID=UPI000E346B0B|nr:MULTISPECIES: DUF4105 domain-containing protein [unclassified Arenibacter]MCM4165257.1 hypothetical protein [Arenibacter sp. A80]RFT55110.1 DUF4105 domain-containing protein [Arenibacter sp. P308M17]
MTIRILFIIFFLGPIFHGAAQLRELSPESQISVLTCGSGSDLYTTFGHSAFRVQDPSQGLDVVYNYGTFNFDPPVFYVEFAMGKLNYSLSKQSMPNFLYAYEMENRWVKEQLLQLNPTERNDLFLFLEKNYLPENRDYKYDFFFNNCATKIGDVLQEALGKNLHFNEGHLEKNYTFRQLIHQNLFTNSWSSFGIDLALGAIIDKTATLKEHMFLPLYVSEQLNNTTLSENDLVVRERSVLTTVKREEKGYFLASPLFWILAMVLFVLTITYIDYKNHVRSRLMDSILFFVTGLAGVVLIFLWFFTDHTATANNFNILWVFPLNLIIGFFIVKKNNAPSWLPKYLLFLLGLLGLTMFLAVFRVQVFSPLAIPLWIMLGVRYLFLWKFFRQHTSLK